MNIKAILQKGIEAKKILMGGHCSLPPSINATYHSKKRKGSNKTYMYTSNEAKAFKKMLWLYMRSIYKKTPYSGNIAYRIGFVFPDKRKRDCSNSIKIFEDAMENAIVLNDRQVKHFDVTLMGYSKEKSGLYFLVYKYTAEIPDL